MTLPFVTAMCPTYRRPRCLRNVVALWELQDYPADRRELIILDDAHQYEPCEGPSWVLVSQAPRFESLPAKYMALAKAARPETKILVVWEDDDVYLPWHVSAHAATLVSSDWSRPTVAWSNYGGTLHQEPATGRFHGSWAYRKDHFEAVGGYVQTTNLIFDQATGGLMATLGKTGDPCEHAPPSYCFRWGNPYYHGQAMPAETFYADVRMLGDPRPQGVLVPQLDDESRRILDEVRR